MCHRVSPVMIVPLSRTLGRTRCIWTAALWCDSCSGSRARSGTRTFWNRCCTWCFPGPLQNTVRKWLLTTIIIVIAMVSTEFWVKKKKKELRDETRRSSEVAAVYVSDEDDREREEFGTQRWLLGVAEWEIIVSYTHDNNYITVNFPRFTLLTVVQHNITH